MNLGVEPVRIKSEEVKKRSKEKAEEVFDVAKKAFESGNLDEIRDEVTAEMLI